MVALPANWARRLSDRVLNVISSSLGELDPVFNAILQNVARICQLNSVRSTSTTELRTAPLLSIIRRRTLRGRGSAKPFALIRIVDLPMLPGKSRSFKSTTFERVNLI